MPSNNLEQSAFHTSLGICFSDKYNFTGSTVNLSLAAAHYHKAIDLLPNDHKDYAECLDSLGVVYGDKYQRFGILEDLEQALQFAQASVKATPALHGSRAVRVHNLGVCYRDRFDRTEAQEDLDKSIEIALEALNLTPAYHVRRAYLLTCLANRYRDSYILRGKIGDLDLAIQKHHDALGFAQAPITTRTNVLRQLAVDYKMRYNRFRAIDDLTQAINWAETALSLMKNSNPSDRTAVLGVLAELLLFRYSRTGNIADLEACIRWHQEALDLTPHDHFHRVRRLEDLAGAYASQYYETKNHNHFEHAVQFYCEARDLYSFHNSAFPKLLSHIGSLYWYRFEETKSSSDLEQSLKHDQEAVDRTLSDDPNRSYVLFRLASTLSQKYKSSGSLKDLQRAIRISEAGLAHSVSHPLARLRSGRVNIRLLGELHDWHNAYKTAALIAPLLPLIIVHHLDPPDRQDTVKFISGLSCDTASIASRAGQPTYEALQFVEAGRGIVTGPLDELRVDISKLHKTYPEIAERFERVRNLNSNRDNSSDYSQKYNAGRDLDAMITEIRHLPSFDTFLLPPSESDIGMAATTGSIVVINVSQYASQAFIVERRNSTTLDLPSLQFEEVCEKAAMLPNIDTDILEWLCTTTAKPILEAMGYLSRSGDQWPRIWWIPTGPLTKFPIHAAGMYDGSSTCETVMDLVISSYSSSIKALVQAQQDLDKIPEKRSAE